MFIATLLTHPNTPMPDTELLRVLCNSWGGDNMTWLDPLIAGEFSLETWPDNLESVWEDLQKMAVDLVIQPAQGRRKSVLLADMDSTIIDQECIDELADEIGIGPQVAQITAQAMNGELNFDEALRARVALLKKMPLSLIDKVLRDRITCAEGAKDLVATMRKHGAYTALVSGGFTIFTKKIAQDLGFDEHRANILLLDSDHRLSGEVQHPILGYDAKMQALQDICAQQNLTSQDVLAVGDGANDLGMLGLAGAGVALHAKPTVAAQCDIRINFGDLRALLYIQGYGRKDFA